MKKLLSAIFVLSCLYLPVITQAQNTFAPLGAEWWYQGSNWDYIFAPPGWVVNETWTDHVAVTGDTTIQGISCRKVVATRTKKAGWNPDSSFVALRSEAYFYDNTDTVFSFNGAAGSFQPLYVLNVSEGDTVCLKNPYAASGMDSTFCYVVDSIQMVVYDTTHLKTFYTHTIIGGSNLYSVNWGEAHFNGNLQKWMNIGQYTERLGGTFGKTGGFFPAITTHNPDGDVAITFPSGYLSCYTDPVTHIKRTSGACDALKNPYSSIASVNWSSYGLTVYPNPSKGAFHISAQKPLTETLAVQLTDLAGRVLKTASFLKGESSTGLDVGKLPNGVYFLKFQAADKAFYQKVVIQH